MNAKKPMAPGEIRRFIDRFSLTGPLDTEGKACIDAGMKHLRMTDAEFLARIERDPQLQSHRPRAGRTAWKEMAAH